MKTEHNILIGKKIERMRILRGLSQTDMARRLNIEPSTYHHIEAGDTKHDLERMKQIAEILDVKPEYLLNPDPIVVYVEHNSGGANGYQPHLVQTLTEETLSRLLDRYDARNKEHVDELRAMNARLEQTNSRLLDLLERKVA